MNTIKLKVILVLVYFINFNLSAKDNDIPVYYDKRNTNLIIDSLINVNIEQIVIFQESDSNDQILTYLLWKEPNKINVLLFTDSLKCFNKVLLDSQLCNLNTIKQLSYKKHEKYKEYDFMIDIISPYDDEKIVVIINQYHRFYFVTPELSFYKEDKKLIKRRSEYIRSIVSILSLIDRNKYNCTKYYRENLQYDLFIK